MYNPYYGVQPGYPPVMQMPQQQRVQNIIKGRMVGSVEEVRAAQVDLDGSATYFPCPAENTIYVKSINLNGMPNVQKFTLDDKQEGPKYLTATDLDEVKKKLSELEGIVKGGTANESNASPANG